MPEGAQSMSEAPQSMSEAKIRLTAALVVSAVLFLFGGYVLFIDGDSSSELQKIAVGWIGLVTGYWLK
jgi:hypothetical protein